VTRHDLAQRVGDWAEAIITHAESQLRQGARETRLSSVGPIHLHHTFTPGSSHADLCDSLTGVARPGAPVMTVHSVQLDLDPDTAALPQFQCFPWSADDFDAYGRPHGLDDSPWRLMWNAAGHEVRCYNRDTRVGLFLTAGNVASWEFSSPMLPFWHWAAAAQGAAMVHGGTIGQANNMGIVGGPSGTGKSTTVLLGMGAGLRSCGDDYVWLQPTHDGTQVWAVFRTIKTVADSTLVPAGTQRIREEGEVRKQIHWVPVSTDPDPHALLPRADLKVAWVLRAPGTRTPTRLDALSDLLPSTLLRVTGDHAAVARTLKQVISSVEVRPLVRDGDFEALARTLTSAADPQGTR
jgi:hypothetical protein